MKRTALALVIGLVCFLAAADEPADYLAGKWVLTPHLQYELRDGEMEVSEAPFYDEPAVFEFMSAGRLAISDAEGTQMTGSWEITERGDLGAALALTMEEPDQGLRLLYTGVSDDLALFALTESGTGSGKTIASGLMERAGGR